MNDLYEEGNSADNAQNEVDCTKCVRQGQVSCLTCINKQTDTGVAEAPVSGG